ncbi:hypothetical protein [Lapillicoccus sp.]|uniref:hypothetical protein n=1 Tax=Lapillicoccus sp. TaxID=1909287 RepID=UPI003267E144
MAWLYVADDRRQRISTGMKSNASCIIVDRADAVATVRKELERALLPTHSQRRPVLAWTLTVRDATLAGQ